jgi:AraC family transcriptional regulator
MKHRNHTIHAHVLPIAWAFCAVISNLVAQTPPAGAEAGIRSADAQMLEALHQKDAARLAQVYAPDAQIALPGQLIRGHDAILAHMEYVVGAGVHDFRIEDQEIFAGDGLAVETGRTMFYDAAGTLMGTDHYMTLWKNIGGSWRIFRDMAVPAGAPAKAAAPAAQAAFAIKQVEPYSAMVLPMTGSYSQISEAIARVGGALGTAPAGPPFTVYFNSPANTPEQGLKWEVGFPAPKGTAASAPFQIREFPGRTVAYAVIAGPYDAQRPWRELIEWAIRQGYQIAGPAMEIWMEGPKTEMRIPVMKKPS